MTYLGLSAEELPTALSDARYVVIQRYDGLRLTEREKAKRLNEAGLHRDLLGDVAQLPKTYELLLEIPAQRREKVYPLTRLFRLNPKASQQAQ
jgi:hypothetical protein